MNRARQIRIKRIKSIDEKQLDLTTIELRKINQLIEERKQIHHALSARLKSSLQTMNSASTLQLKQQIVAFSTKTDSQLQELGRHVGQLETKRNDLLDVVREQRAKVKGWELLLKNLDDQHQEALRKEDMILADDQFLGKAVVKNRRSK
jgi:thioesterase domain-containing protein